MGKESIVLLKKPKIEFVFQTNGFKVINEKNNIENEFYEYRLVESFSFEKKKVNWIAFSNFICRCYNI